MAIGVGGECTDALIGEEVAPLTQIAGSVFSNAGHAWREQQTSAVHEPRRYVHQAARNHARKRKAGREGKRRMNLLLSNGVDLCMGDEVGLSNIRLWLLLDGVE